MGEAPYKKLLTYRYAYLIYHLNDQFTGQYLGDYRNRRNKEQMDQAARSGKQNIPPVPPLPADRELATNLMADLITRTCYLLDQQIRRLKEKFIREGGFSENLFKQRKEYRGF